MQNCLFKTSFEIIIKLFLEFTFPHLRWVWSPLPNQTPHPFYLHCQSERTWNNNMSVGKLKKTFPKEGSVDTLSDFQTIITFVFYRRQQLQWRRNSKEWSSTRWSSSRRQRTVWGFAWQQDFVSLSANFKCYLTTTFLVVGQFLWMYTFTETAFWLSYNFAASGSTAAAQEARARAARRIMTTDTKASKLAIGPGSTLFNQGTSLRECPGGRDAPRGAGTQPPGAGIIPRGSKISIPWWVERASQKTQLIHLFIIWSLRWI